MFAGFRPEKAASSKQAVFERARTINRPVRAESKMELASDETLKDLVRSRWQSIGALTDQKTIHQSGGSQALVNLSRLKKSYATMRKSFRVQGADRSKRHLEPCNAESSDDLGTNEGYNRSKSSNLIGQIGSNAVRLFRGVYGKSQQSGNFNQFELDTMAQSTNGSFKVLSSTVQHETIRKSDAELEIDQRLRRSKRRVLPSARYKAPDCEHACDDLDLDKLEAIKRDNLRLTLRSLIGSEHRGAPIEANSRSVHDHEKLETDVEDQRNLCSCKSVEIEDEANYNSHEQQLYCSCLSLESSISPNDLLLGDQETRPPEISNQADSHQNDEDIERQADEEVATNDERNNHEDEVPRASGGFEGEQFEDKLGKMFVGFLREQQTTSGKLGDLKTGNKDNTSRVLENVCGERQEDSGRAISSSPSSSSLAYCVQHLSLAERDDQKETARDSKFSVIDGLSELQLEQQQQPEWSAGETTADDERMQSARNCCKLGGVSSFRSQAEGVSQQPQEESPAVAMLFEKRNNRQQQQQQSESRSSATSGDHGRPKQRNSFGCAKNKPATTLTRCHNGVDGAKVRALSVAASSGRVDGQSRKARRLARRERDENSDRSVEILTAKSEERVENMNLWPTRGYVPSQELVDEMHRSRGDKYHLAMIGPEQPEEHLYASIYCNQSTPSPERQNQHQQMRDIHYDYPITDVDALYHEQPFAWQQGYNDHETLMSLNNRDLFDKQLNNNHKFESTYKDPMKKKSIFCRIKKLIIPAGNKSNINGHKTCLNNDISNDITPPPHPSWGHNTYRSPFDKCSMKHKSATLSSRSTQNLLTNSRHYLSTSRKSMNNAIVGYDDEVAEEDSTGVLRKSFMNGFLTLGRRNKHCLSKHQSVSQIFNDNKQRKRLNSMSVGNRRAFGSADSLHSADSGLSCSNLQNSSSSDENNYVAIRENGNLYSGDPRDECVNSLAETNTRFSVVGKAVAKVDCNPCAYDKEALVFKRGDIIDILERDQSGSWIGRCNGQIGHFKFINVTEIPMDESEESEASDNDDVAGEAVDVNDGEKMENDTSSEKREGFFITKLEIKSNNNDIPTPSLRNRTNTQRLSLTSSRRSLSMNTIDPSTATTTITNSTETSVESSSNRLACDDSGISSRDNCLSNSNETIMSSLEQLLFAIGLAEETVTTTGLVNGLTTRRKTSLTTGADNNQQQSVAVRESEEQDVKKGRVIENNKEQQQITHLSYLNLLSEKGINSLDSFSAIDDCHELEQLGITDDEHQRRLLMAARIIRQASQAAKSDFVQNYRFKPDYSRSSVRAMASVGGAHETSSLSPVTTPDTVKQTLSDGVGIMPPVVETKARRSSSRNEPVYVNLVSARSESIRTTEPPTAIGACKDRMHARDHKIQIESSLRNPEYPGKQRRSAHPSETSRLCGGQALGLPTGESGVNSNNQSTYYHTTRRRPSLSQDHRQSSAMARSSRYVEQEQPHLVRGYSIRPHISSFKEQEFNSQRTNDLRCRDRLYPRNASSNLPISKFVAFKGPLATTSISQQQTNRVPASHQVFRKKNSSRESKDGPVPTIFNSQRSQMMLLNSRSAYDLRFDLSHFFT